MSINGVYKLQCLVLCVFVYVRVYVLYVIAYSLYKRRYSISFNIIITNNPIISNKAKNKFLCDSVIKNVKNLFSCLSINLAIILSIFAYGKTGSIVPLK